VYSLLVVFQRRGGSGLAVVIVVAIAAGMVGCGPIDSRPPSDAGVGGFREHSATPKGLFSGHVW
jgi:hypothetical protein